MTDQNRTNQEKDEAVRANAPDAQAKGERDKAKLDAEMLDTEQARAAEKADKQSGLTKKAQSRELDKELEESMDGSDPPSSTQP